METHALRAVPRCRGGPALSTAGFSPGANGYRQHNTFQVEDLASQGYVVVAIDHPGAAREVMFPDGRRAPHIPSLIDIPRFFSEPRFSEEIFNYLAGDISFALDRTVDLDAHDPDHVLTGRLDTEKVGMFGVSLGGLVAAEACRQDPRINACLIEDVFVPGDVIAAGIDQPTMWLSRDADSMRAEGWSEEQVDIHQASMRAAFEAARTTATSSIFPACFI